MSNWINVRRRLLVVGAFFMASHAMAGGNDGDRGPNWHNPPTRTVVLVHGAFADGSGWGDVVRLLQEEGVKVVSVQNPLTSMAADVAAANRVINQQTQPVVLVGHSWGGVVITHAGMNPKVDSLVYLAAFAPDIGESVYSLTVPYPAAPWINETVADEAGNLTLSEKAFLKYFVPDLPSREAKALAAVQGPTFGGTLLEPATVAAWKVKPTWYMLAKRDQMISPGLQLVMAAKMNARVTTVEGGHVPMLYNPKKVTAMILDAVRGKDR